MWHFFRNGILDWNNALHRRTFNILVVCNRLCNFQSYNVSKVGTFINTVPSMKSALVIFQDQYTELLIILGDSLDFHIALFLKDWNWIEQNTFRIFYLMKAFTMIIDRLLIQQIWCIKISILFHEVLLATCHIFVFPGERNGIEERPSFSTWKCKDVKAPTILYTHQLISQASSSSLRRGTATIYKVLIVHEVSLFPARPVEVTVSNCPLRALSWLL